MFNLEFLEICKFVLRTRIFYRFLGSRLGAKHSSYLKICRPGGASVWAPCRADVIFEHVCSILTDQMVPDRDGASVTFRIILVLLAHYAIFARGGP